MSVLDIYIARSKPRSKLAAAPEDSHYTRSIAKEELSYNWLYARTERSMNRVGSEGDFASGVEDVFLAGFEAWGELGQVSQFNVAT